MDPAGPHFFKGLPISAVPKKTLKCFEGEEDNLTKLSYHVPISSQIRNARHAKNCNVLYMVDHPSRTQMGFKENMFYIPVGKPYSHKYVQWEKVPEGIRELCHVQDFAVLPKEFASTFSNKKKMDRLEWNEGVLLMMKNADSVLESLLVPKVNWSLSICLVPDEVFKVLEENCGHVPQELVHHNQRKYLFAYEKRENVLSHGVPISSWVLGDPQVTSTQVLYPFLPAYKDTYGSGYGSRPRSNCLDSVNSYRDRRFNTRVHPSPFVKDEDIGLHQYYSASKQKSCLLQMKLETILHQLANDATYVAERINPNIVRVTSGLATKLIATTGQSLFSFFNGLHVDACDKITPPLKSSVFPLKVIEEEEKMFTMADCSFPTTCGYQHVWKHSCDMMKYTVIHHFVLPGLGLGISLEDGVCHHFQGGSFSHCTALCILLHNTSDEVLSNNESEMFRIFGWGNSVNARNARGNIGRENMLGQHRDIVCHYRCEGSGT
jgi:hypothetical protein